MRIDFEFGSNAPAPYAYVFYDGSGQATSFTGFTFKLQIKARVNGAPSGSVLYTLTTGSGIAGTLASGQWQPTFPTLIPAGDYIYDCLRLSGGDPVEELCWGWITVRDGVTS